MRNPSSWLSVFLAWVLVSIILPHAAAAGTIHISGSLIFADSGVGSLSLVGDRGFTLNAVTHEAVVSGGPLSHTACSPCFPGQGIQLTMLIIGSGILNGFATLDGNTHSGIGGFLPSAPQLVLEFHGDEVIAPPRNVASIVSLTNPVIVGGLFIHGAAASGLEFETLVGGSATATVALKHSPCTEGDGCWFAASARYDIQPVPQPAALLFWGTGAAGLGLARWYRRRPSERGHAA